MAYVQLATQVVFTQSPIWIVFIT